MRGLPAAGRRVMAEFSNPALVSLEPHLKETLVTLTMAEGAAF
jgi:hypothetical protein